MIMQRSAQRHPFTAGLMTLTAGCPILARFVRKGGIPRIRQREPEPLRNVV
jgi:hypothetical protein